jgi:hypothetical protein
MLSLPPNAATDAGGLSVVGDAEGASRLGFSAPAYAVSEDAGSFAPAVERTAEDCEPASVNHATSNRAAAAGSDYVAKSGTLTFAVNLSSVVNATSLIAQSGGAIVDSDAGGHFMPDDYETSRGQSPNNPADTRGDVDGDGTGSLQEAYASTNPRDPQSAFRIAAPARRGNDMVIGFTSVAGKNCRIETCTSILAPVWTTARDHITGAGSALQAIGAGAVDSGRFFHRVVLLP